MFARAVSALLLAVLAAAAAVAPAAAEPQLEQPVLLAIKAHYIERLTSEYCNQYFAYYAMDVRNYNWSANEVKVEVQFYAKFKGLKTLYGRSEGARRCLGEDKGEGFFQPDTSYESAKFVYSLSRWTTGWHIDKLEYQY